MQKTNKVALIGYTGLIGKIILNELKKKKIKIFKFNSKNIKKIKEKRFNEIYCAGLPAEKWKANKFPAKDKRNAFKLINNLKKTYCNKFYLISTIDVHKSNETYGKNRLMFENYIKLNFSNFLIIRLPGVFGSGLKKNIIFDLLNKKNLEKISSYDYFQWYDLNFLVKDIIRYEKKYGINKIIELYSRPIQNSEIINFFPNLEIRYSGKKKIKYNFKPKIGYYKSKKIILNRIKKFIKNYEK